jgi:hypothetical protein
VPELSLDGKTYRRLLRTLDDADAEDLADELEAAVREAFNHRLMGMQTCDRCGDDRVPTIYCVGQIDLCGQCNAIERENAMVRAVVAHLRDHDGLGHIGETAVSAALFHRNWWAGGSVEERTWQRWDGGPRYSIEDAYETEFC